MNYFSRPGSQFCSIVIWTLEGTCSRLVSGQISAYISNISFKLHFSVQLNVFYQFMKVTEIIPFFKTFSVFNFNLRRVTYKYKTKWKWKRSPQTCYWRRASQIKQLKARGVCSLFTVAFRECLVPYCSFLLPKRPWRTKCSTFQSLSSILRETVEFRFY